MVRPGGSPYAFNATAAQASVRALDEERVADVAQALGRMTPMQRERLSQIAKAGPDALYPEVVTVQHIVNDIRRERVQKRGGNYVEAFLNPGHLLRGLERYATASAGRA